MKTGVRYQLRMGLVLYGGASLAIYMNGMVQEILALLRAAHARRLAGSDQESDWVRDQLDHNPYCRLLESAQADVMVDVIAGTSAGGLNGLMLAKALACGAPDLDGLTRLWQDVAQIHKLAMFDDDPRSVLNGDLLFQEMHRVMQELSAQADPALAAMAPVLDLFVTATDVGGHRWSGRDRFHQKIEGLAHRYVFHLRKRTPQGAGRGYAQNDFWAGPENEVQQAKRDTLLAKIGRATSAFPAVFPPVYIGRQEAKEAGIPILHDLEGQEGLWFSDGGILANKPFEPVLNSILNRSADLPVRRLVAFLEPDPVPVQPKERSEPSMVETAMAAATLPMSQDIKEYLDRLKDENQRRQQLLRFMTDLDAAVERMGATGETGVQSRADGALQRAMAEAAAAAASPAPMLQAYHELRLDRLRAVLCGALDQALDRLGVAPEESRREAVASLLDQVPILQNRAAESGPLQSFLRLFDAEFHVRRLHFMLARLHSHYRPGVIPNDQQAMREVLSRLWGALEDWNNARWMVANAGSLPPQPEPWRREAEHLNTAFADWAAALHSGVAGGTGQACTAVITALSRYMNLVRERSAAEEEAALSAAERAFPLSGVASDGASDSQPPLTVTSLKRLSREFEPMDLLLFPLQTYAHGGDWDTVGLYRLCPGAADGWVKKETTAKLAGESLGHFGAFLDERWRSNDIMWGRLDGAELLVKMLVRESGLVDLKPDQPLTETQYPPVIQAVLERRRRQIMADFPQLIDLSSLHGTSPSKPAMAGQPPLPLAGRLAAAYRLLTTGHLATLPTGQAAAAAMTAGQRPVSHLDSVPYSTLRKYLKDQYQVGAEGLDSLPTRRLAGEILLILHNTVHALRRPAPSALLKLLQLALVLMLNPLNWLARLILVPRKGLFGMVQENLVPLLTAMGMTLLLLQMLGAIRLNTGGWSAVIVFLGPVALDSLFRPSLLRVFATGALALAAMAGRLQPLIISFAPDSASSEWHWLAPLIMPLQPWLSQMAWLPLLGRIWLFAAALFGSVTLAFVLQRKWDRKRP